ncbi:M56 family metallopeptidase [Yinghuangia aomiensis]|uniref:M56 family metallopeptidase n=2 Tax=Yinghuangia aomiensis TaxID=676205 RepID=A0ABP9GYA0_9ACTN
MRFAVYLPMILPLSALPVARLAVDHLHPRTATRLLTGVAAVLALCSTWCVALLVIVGSAQVPGNPLPDGWGDPGVRDAVPHVRLFGSLAMVVLSVVVTASAAMLLRDRRVRRRARAAIAALPDAGGLVVIPDERPYAYALPGREPRVVATTAMLACLTRDERRALIAHEHAHLAGRHHVFLTVSRLAAVSHPLLRPLRTAIAYTVERWADEDAAAAVGDRTVTARAVGKAALSAAKSGAPAASALPAFAARGPVPRRVAALLGPPPTSAWPAPASPTGFAAIVAAAGTTVSVCATANAAFALFVILKASTAL